MRAQPEGSHFVDGAFAEGAPGSEFESRYPATNEVIARLTRADDALIERAVSSAARAQRVWAAADASERGRVLRRVADLMRRDNRALSVLETLDTGKPLQETLVADAASGADGFEYFGSLAATETGAYHSTSEGFAYSRRVPLGVCFGIGAWNYPIQVASWKAAPALACGNAMIFKPSEETPLSALRLAALVAEAGAPAGLFQVLQGRGSELGARLIGHRAVAKVSLTGSSATGRRVMEAAARAPKPVTLELGGKSPLIVFADADLESAVSASMLANFYSSGQICSNGTRVFVERGLRDAFLERLAARTARLRFGDPLDESTQMGPLISAAQKERVLSYIGLGLEEGARLVCGGLEPPPLGGGNELAEGFFVAPTVFADVRDGMRIAREEIFGPVMCVLDFDGEEEAVARANDTEYGLSAGVFTRDLARGHRVVSRLEAGTCWINHYNLTPAGVPFGGVKGSGFGRENAAAALEGYSQIQSVQVSLVPVESPY